MQNGLMEPRTNSDPLETEIHTETRVARHGKPGWPGRAWGFLVNTLFAVLLLTIALLVFAMVQSRISGAPPQIAGYQMYIVVGASMSPTFEAGSLAFLQPVDPEGIQAGDVITYRGRGGDSSLTTHRVMAVHHEEGALTFTTRGDANQVNDAAPVGAGAVVGKVKFTVPYAGFLMDFAQTPKGLLALVIVPGVLVIIFELRNIVRYVTRQKSAQEHEKAQADI